MSKSSQSFTRAKDELLLPLFFCRVAVFIVFCVWIYSKLMWPERGAGRMKSFWLVDGFPEWGIVLFSCFELVVAVLFVLGLYKRATRAFFMVLAFFSFATPRALGGFIRAFEVQPWHTVLHFSAFSLFACTVALYVLRDYDTLFSLNKADKGKQ